jgi:hypothetical protein
LKISTLADFGMADTLLPVRPLEHAMPNRQFSKVRLKLSLILLTVGAPAFIIALAFGQHVLVLLSLFPLIFGVALGTSRLVCPQCGKRNLAIATDVKHCCYCGASYFPQTTTP